MKLYIHATHALSDEDIVEKFTDSGIELTTNPFEAIYLLRNGKLISGGFYDGVRGEDHRCVQCLFDDINRYSPNFWEECMKRTGMVILIPENRQAMMLKSQILTVPQQKILKQLNYTPIVE